jgi:hypothetical protein
MTFNSLNLTRRTRLDLLDNRIRYGSRLPTSHSPSSSPHSRIACFSSTWHDADFMRGIRSNCLRVADISNEGSSINLQAR